MKARVITRTHDEPLPADAEPMTPGYFLQLERRGLVDAQAALKKLTSAEGWPTLHPLIHRVDAQPARVEGSRTVVELTIHERVPLLGGLVQWPNRYRGRFAHDATRPDEARVSGWATAGVRIELRYRVRGDVLEETLWARAPRLLAAFLYATLLDAHEHTLLKLE